MDGPGFQLRWGRNFTYPSRQDPRSSQRSRVSAGFPGDKAVRAWRWPPFLTSTKIVHGGDILLRLPLPVPSWHPIGWPLNLVTTYKGKAIPFPDWTSPECFKRLRLPDIKKIDTWKWKDCEPYAPATFTPPPPRKYSWHVFLIVAESTPWRLCGRKYYVNAISQWHHRISNPRPSGL